MTKTCPRCQLVLRAHILARHIDKSRCRGRQAAAVLFAQGLRPVEFKWQAKSGHAATALHAFGLDVELHPTRCRKHQDDNGASRRGGTGAGSEAWTSEEGVSLALMIEEVARLLALSYPEAARRMSDHRELIGSFGTAWLLGASGEKDDWTLIQILQPINYVIGSDGKHRWRKPIKLSGRSDVVDWEWA